MSPLFTLVRLQELLSINSRTGIETRAVVDLWNEARWHHSVPPTAEEVDSAYRVHGTKLTVEAAGRALDESSLHADEVTHMVAVTATNAGSPGYDLLVAKELGIGASAERTLLSGVGCAGGLAALRVASNVVIAATTRSKSARVLVVACEICSIHIRAELEASSKSDGVGIGPSLFGDGAVALVLCNPLALTPKTPVLYSLVDWRSSVVADSLEEMSYKVTNQGFLLHLSKRVPELAAKAVAQPFEDLATANGFHSARPGDFDWALHPGGLSIIKGVQTSMGLSNHALRASSDMYRTRGNASSVSVLAILDKLRSSGPGLENVIACSFGPGLTVEMALIKRLS